jgi:outer membrane protein OmpA-like peptidoglycan-associated protein
MRDVERAPGAHASREGRTRLRQSSTTALAQLSALQRQAGNAGVARLLAATKPTTPVVVAQRCGPVPCDCNDEDRAAKEGTGPQVQRVVAEPVVMRLSETQFQARLGATQQQRAAIDALFSDPTFLSLWTYLRSCRSASGRQDLGPLALEVTPGLSDGGVERFGGYSPLSRTLEINPTKPEHRTNPSELVDTVVHELIHAVDHLQTECRAAGSPPPPLGGAATTGFTPRTPGGPDEDRLNRERGPGASNPCGEFIDINAAAQDMIVRVLRNNIQVATIGRPTLTFLNVIIRRDPAALAAYEACRSAACATTPGRPTNAAVDRCAAQTIARFIPPDLRPALLPARIHFDLGANVLRADDVPTADMVALFLVAHPAVTVGLVGHTDPSGSRAVNRRLGLRRAERIRDLLLRAGVPATQIRSLESRESRDQLSSSADTRWKDRRVEVVP